MLVLSRKPGEQIVIGEDIVITVVDVHGDRVRLGFQCPAHSRASRGSASTHSRGAIDKTAS